MELRSKLQSKTRGTLDVVYRDVSSYEELERLGVEIHHVGAFAFCGGLLVIVYDKGKGMWMPPSGARKVGESLMAATAREVREESNMRVLKQVLIGYQSVTERDGRIVNQTRSYCLVEPYGPFLSDPDGDISEIKLIDPTDVKKYFDWGEVGDHVLRLAVESSRVT